MHEMLHPKRHMGAVHLAARCNMSPVVDKFFAATRSMQNAQILHGTNGVARYVVKYIVKLDDGNRCTVWEDSHTGAVMRAEHHFLHNTKITSSKANEDKAFKKSRDWHKPSGRAIAFTEMQQHILGYPEVMTTLRFVRICTKPFEQRPTTRVKLNENGDLIRPDSQGVEDTQSSIPSSQRAREAKQFPPERFMTPSQQLLSRNNGGAKSFAYDEITQFSLRPVEMLELFPKVGEYFRWFQFGDEALDANSIDEKLSLTAEECSWVDGLGRLVRLRREAMGEVKNHLLRPVDEGGLTLTRAHSLLIKDCLLEMITSAEDGNPMAELEERFVYEDNGEDLRIPVFSSVTPRTPIPFLLHVMLMCGKFETELDLRMQGTMRESLAAANLIGNDFDNHDALMEYSNTLIKLVITDVFSVQPVSLRRLDGFVVLARRLFNSILFDNEIPISDLPPCILTEMLNEKDEKLTAFWETKKEDQLTSIYQTLTGIENVPGREAVMSCSKFEPVDWNPVDTFTQFEYQSSESFDEQKTAISVGARSIQKYSQQFGPEASTFTKGNITHGAPGSGKTHINQYLTLYAMSQGLRVMTTTLMAARANLLGGIHFHRLLAMIPRKTGNPYREAELALEKLHRKSNITYLHTLLTMDVLVIDECGQFSAQQLSVLDIVLRLARNSDIPFGGVLILGTMDHTQLGAIDGWPFLLSSHILTDFLMVRLCHSVRAHRDPAFQRIQALTRMPPSELLGTPGLEEEFKQLLRDNMTFVDGWDDERITADTQRMYARRIPAYEASNEYVQSCQHRFESDGTPFVTSTSVDLKRTADTRAEFVPVLQEHDTAIISALNHGVREPEKLLFWRGAQFEATVNDEDFSQSQLLLMLDVPSSEMIRMKTPIHLMAAPPGINYIDVSIGVPSQDELLAADWKPVRVGHTPERPITHRGMVGCRQQYALRHIGSSTINKQLGNTITGTCALECGIEGSPWEKAQVVVGLSRTMRAQDTIIVGPVQFAVDRFWELITIANQWTSYVEMLLDRLSVNGSSNLEHQHVFNYAEVFPYRTCDIELPMNSSGFVYMLVSVRDFDRDYVGQTENLARRFYEHNSGHGAEGTSDPYYRPYCVAAYICGLAHMAKAGREDLEWRWKLFNVQALIEGRTDIQSRIDQGRRVVENYNVGRSDCEKIRFMVTMKRAATAGDEH